MNAAVHGLSEQELMDMLAAKRAEKTRNRDAYRALVEETVPLAIERLQQASEMLSEVKKDVFQLASGLLALKFDAFETPAGRRESQQSHTFTVEGKYSITLGYRIIEAWDDSAQDGIAKVKDFLGSMAKDAESAALVETIFRLLKQDKNGNLRASRILELQRIADRFNNAEFYDAVRTIAEAYKPRRSCWFIEAYVYTAAGDRMPLPLSVSAADFPPGFEFDMIPAQEQAA